MRYLIALILLLCGTVGAVETGWTALSSVSQLSDGDGINWTNASGVYSTMNLDTGGGTNTLVVTWALGIPSDATIDGIRFRYSAKSNTATDMAEYGFRIRIGGVAVGNDLYTSANYTTSYATYSHGSATDVFTIWGITPTATEVNSISVGLYCLDDGGGDLDDVWVDTNNFEINVDYTLAAEGEGEGEGEGEFFLFFNR